MSTRPPIHWILDWDGTLTQKDTLDALVNIAASSKPNAQPPTLDRWKKVVDAYMTDYTSRLEKLAPNGSLPTTSEGERQLLKDMEPVEHRSLDRVYDAGVFEGLTKDVIEAGAKRAIDVGDVALRPGVAEFFRRIQARGDEVHILSVNWSRHFIHSCLSASNISLPSSRILANEISSDGRIASGIVCSGDKMRELQNLPGTIVYVGDSWTDIECLLAADVGICIRDEPVGSGQRKLAGALERLGVHCFPLSESNGVNCKGVVWARDFVGIGRWADELLKAEL